MSRGMNLKIFWPKDQSLLSAYSVMIEQNERKAKEDALAGLTGGSFAEIVTLLLIIPCSILMYRSLYALLLRRAPSWVSTIAGAIFAIAPLLLSMSIYTEYTISFCVASLIISFICNTVTPSDDKSDTAEEVIERMNGRLKPFLSNYRATMMLATCTAILAVDFNLLFPVRFAKCEEYGISLMDIGVGGFIFSSALTSAKSGTSSSTTPPTTHKGPNVTTRSGHAAKEQKYESPSPSWASRMLQSLKLVVPLLILGLGRFTLIKALGYQEHVSEYGMHWNFFMTLAGITLLTAALNVPLQYSGIIGVAILLVYDYVLRSFGVADYIISAPRSNFFSQNREGILSCFGYFALYLLGRQFGAFLMIKRSRSQWWKALGTLVAIGAGCWVAAASMRALLAAEPSRRMVNLSYALYTISANCFVLAAFVMIDLLARSDAPNALVDSVANRRNSQLVVFTLSNLMTGAMNMVVGTFNRPPEIALGLMGLYMAAVALISLSWHPVLAHLMTLFSRSNKLRH